MQNTTIHDAVLHFIHLMQQQPEEILDKPWSWESYSSEGVRFAFFRTYEELVELSAIIKTGRTDQGLKITLAQHILGGYQSAYCDLKAVLGSAAPDILGQSPGGDAWSIRQTLNHIIGADIGFYAIIKYALIRNRLQDGRPMKMTEADWDEITELTDEKYDALFASDYAELTAYHAMLQDKVITEFSSIQVHELPQLSVYWEEAPMPIQFRLLRFESHMRQHTIQIEKTIAAITGSPSEVHRLIRMVYAGLAGVESACLGAPGNNKPAQEKAAQIISARTAELQDLLK